MKHQGGQPWRSVPNFHHSSEARRLRSRAPITDIGIDDGFMRELGEAFEPGTSALFILVREARLDKVLPEISRYGGKVLRTSLPKEQEEKIQAALMGEARNQTMQRAA